MKIGKRRQIRERKYAKWGEKVKIYSWIGEGRVYPFTRF